MTVRPVPVPKQLSGQEAAAFLAVTGLLADVQVELWGTPDLAFTARELWARGHYDEDTRHDFYAAYRDDPEGETAAGAVAPPGTLADETPAEPSDPPPHGEVGGLTGAAWCFSPLRDNTHMTQFRLGVDPRFRRRGIGSAVLAVIEQRARAEGRTTLLCFSEHPREAAPGEPGALIPPTGFGSLPGGDPGVTFLQRHGFTLEQSSRHSVLYLPADPAVLDRIDQEAGQRAGGYQIVTWRGATPADLLGPMAQLMTAMSVEVPEAGLDIGAEEWTPERVAQFDERMAHSGRETFVAVARHRVSGQLAGYTMMACVDEVPIAIQQDTLVLPAHRGHRLGWWLKATNLRSATAARPALARVHTWNAEENGPVLAINDDLGFVPEGAWASWQKRLT